MSTTSITCPYCAKVLSGLRADGTLPRHAVRGTPCIGGGFPPPPSAKQIIGEARARVRQSKLGTTGSEVEKHTRKGRTER